MPKELGEPWLSADSCRGHPHDVAGSVVRSECQEFRPVIAQPIALLAPVRTMSLDERPELSRVVRDAQVAELVHDHVVEHFGRREHQSPVEGERAARRAGTPERALSSDTDSAVLDADPLSLVLR